MKNLEIVCPVKVAEYAELSVADRELVDAARQATTTSYAPYSNFHVGAALRLANGVIVKGSNQENAATPSGICAERTAAFWAGANHPGVAATAIAIAAVDGTGQEVNVPISPCGACRQVLLEYEKLAGSPMRVLLVGASEIQILPSIRSLLPLAFTEF